MGKEQGILLMSGDLERIFPRLSETQYKITSPIDVNYNCIAWAAGDNCFWWEPDPWGQYYWPDRIPREMTLDAYIQAYQSLGYEQCEDGNLEVGHEKVALFVKAGLPMHAARQLQSGKWTSKLGELHDIEHELKGVEGSAYGGAVVYMKRLYR